MAKWPIMKWIHNQGWRLKIKTRMIWDLIAAALLAVIIAGVIKLEFNLKERYSVAAALFLWECG